MSGHRSTSRQATVREAAFDLFRAFGMTTIFGNPGSTELPMFRDFPDDFRYVLGLQESVAVGMADGFAQATRNAGAGQSALGGRRSATRSAICSPPIATDAAGVVAGQQARSILPYQPFLYAEQAAEFPKTLCQMELRAGAGRGRARGDRPRLSTSRCSRRAGRLLRLGAGRRLGPAVRAARGAPGRPRRCAATRSLLAELAGALASARSGRPSSSAPAVARDDAWDETIALAERHAHRSGSARMSSRNSFPEDHPLFAGFLAADRERSSPTSPGTTSSSCSARRSSPIMSRASGRISPTAPTCSSSSTIPPRPPPAPVGTAIVGGIRAGAGRACWSGPDPKPRPQPRPWSARPRRRPSR